MFDNAPRLDHLKKRAIHGDDDLVRRALDASDALLRRTLDGQSELLHRAQARGEGLADRARSRGEDLLGKVTPMAAALGGGVAARLPERVRRALPHKPAPVEEPRSFLASPTVAIAGAVAIGMVAGIALTIGRKAAVQGSEALHGDWLEVLKAEHRLVDKLFDQLMRTTEKQTIRRAFLLNRIAHALSRHAIQEEMVVYPALKEASANGQAMHLYEDHAQIKIFIHELNEIPNNDPLWIERARAFRECINHHVREEEDEIYPPYHDRMSPQQNRHITVGLHKEGMKLA